MVVFRFLFCFLMLALFTFESQAQTDSVHKHPEKATYADLDFHPPMGIPLFLAGNFCELRSNHFHTGLDIKTGGVIGKKVYSIEDGYVSRVKVGLWGYGKVIYIRHPNGFTSVYAHLNKFNPTIEAYIKKAQYNAESFEIELFPSSDELVVKKGEQIGLSGNSGSSTAPHLHFEIRETATEHPINPLLCGFDIKDNVKPSIRYFRMYPLSDSSTVNDMFSAKSYKVEGSNGTYKYSGGPIPVHGEIGFALDVVDKLNGMRNICGTYTIELYVDSQQVFGQRLEKMNFGVNRYINAHMDYELWKKDSRHFQRSYLLPNNRLPIYENVLNRGHVTINDGAVHQVKYVVEDAYGNTSTLSFEVKDSTPKVWPTYAERKDMSLVEWDEEYVYKEDSFALFMPPNILYDDLYIDIAEATPHKYSIGKQFAIHNRYTPLQSYFTIKFRADSTMLANADKCMVVSISKGGKIYNEKGTMENGWLSARSRSFGTYTVMMDRKAPVISPKNFVDGQNMAKNTEISLKITDNLSGIKKYRGTIDGKWVLFQYDPQRSKVWYVFDDKVGTGEHELKFTVYDERGNKKVYTAKFTR